MAARSGSISGGRGFLRNKIDDIRTRFSEMYPYILHGNKEDRALLDQLVYSNYNKNRSISTKDRNLFRESEKELKSMIMEREIEIRKLNKRSKSVLGRALSAPSIIVSKNPYKQEIRKSKIYYPDKSRAYRISRLTSRPDVSVSEWQ